MTAVERPWLELRQGDAPLIVSLPHTGADIPREIEARLVSPWLARKDADWWVDRLYDFAAGLGATTLRTAISRTVIDVNRDPSGASLYPGQATTGLCPTTTFEGEPLYRSGREPQDPEVIERRTSFFEPYHAALAAQIARLRACHERVVVYDAHSIRSLVPRLFAGTLPHFNIGTNDGRSCDPRLSTAVEAVCGATAFSTVINGRFKGGWITRSYGRPSRGVHGLQMELACRAYMEEPPAPGPGNWPAPFSPSTAAPLREALSRILDACLAFALAPRRGR
ncbi:MAG TPA: N-formylglutamate deformylase [Caulobacteraceae bacterium]